MNDGALEGFFEMMVGGCCALVVVFVVRRPEAVGGREMGRFFRCGQDRERDGSKRRDALVFAGRPQRACVEAHRARLCTHSVCSSLSALSAAVSSECGLREAAQNGRARMLVLENPAETGLKDSEARLTVILQANKKRCAVILLLKSAIEVFSFVQSGSTFG